MTDLFVDTSAWFDVLVPRQPSTEAIEKILYDSRWRLVTTDFVIDEVMTLLKARKQFGRRADVWRFLNDPNFVSLCKVSESDWEATFRIFSRFVDKGWSFTDCSSLAVMNRRGIQNACSLDKHFREFGNVTVLP